MIEFDILTEIVAPIFFVNYPVNGWHEVLISPDGWDRSYPGYTGAYLHLNGTILTLSFNKDMHVISLNNPNSIEEIRNWLHQRISEDKDVYTIKDYD